MTDVDKRIAEWSRADADKAAPGRASYRAETDTPPNAGDCWCVTSAGGREKYARMAVAAIDAYVADKVVIEVTGMHE